MFGKLSLKNGDVFELAFGLTLIGLLIALGAASRQALGHEIFMICKIGRFLLAALRVIIDACDVARPALYFDRHTCGDSLHRCASEMSQATAASDLTRQFVAIHIPWAAIYHTPVA